MKAANPTRRRSADRLRIEQGTVVYRDAAAGTVRRLEDLEANLSAGSLKGPFTVKGGVRMMGMSLTIEGRFGRFALQRDTLRYRFRRLKP